MKHKRILAAFLAAAVLLGCFPAYAAEDGVIEIATAQQMIEFSKNCTLDTWSQGKTAVLTADIDLTGTAFSPVPTFGGTFDGGGHTISGLSVTQNGSCQGLFRYVQENAVVQNLNVSGKVAPGGSGSTVGGIAGRNFGILQNCSFRGTVSGKNSVGGIAGINEGTGELLSCTGAGTVSGEHYTGGITGQNLGSVVSCENRAQVNTREEEISVSLEEFNWEQVNSAENFRAHTDSGGIAGYSSGILQSCTNEGAVGYPHTGYNVGGIVGRQCGFLDRCVNRGEILGRKDVGGICGQLEPYLLLQFDEDSLQALDGELDTLRALLEQLGNEAALTGDLLNLHGDTLSEKLAQVRADAHHIADWSGDFLDGTTNTVNELSARVTRTFDRLEPIFGDLGSTGDGLGDAFRQAADLLDNAENASVWGEDAAQEARTAFNRLGSAMDGAHDALRAIRAGIAALRQNPGDREAQEKALAELSQAVTALRDALSQAGTVSEALADLLRALGQAGGIVPGETPQWLVSLAEGFRQASTAAGSIWEAVSGMVTGANGPTFRERLHESLALLRQGLTAGSDAMSILRRASNSLNRAFDNLETLSDELDGTLSGMADAFSELDRAMGFAGDAAQGMEDLSRELADEPVLEIPALNSEYTSTADAIFDTLEEISNDVGSLRGDLSSSGDRMHSTASAVNDQIGVISDLLMDGYHDIVEDEEEGERLEDISDQDDGSTQGRIGQSVNEGTVAGDVDVGGITGSMAIEYDLDPEDDIIRSGQRSMNFRYQTRAVMDGCRNEGEVTAKKDHAGGIVGRMELGRVSSCEGYGTVSSTDGAYVGGIAGASYASIRNSWAKCALSGENYVGGIAGFGTDLSGCRALTEITATGECAGAIAGDADGVLSQNLFVGDALGGVDGISYRGKAEPVAYDLFLASEGLPDAFQSFLVTFLVDGETFAEILVDFDGSIEDAPEVPVREGLFGEWSDENFRNLRADKTVEAVYSPYITVLESAAAADGKPLLLAEGEFDRHAELLLEPLPDASADAPGEAFRARVSKSVSARSGHLLRALAGEQDNAVWLLRDGRWRKTDSMQDGSYLVFSIDGDEAVYCVGREVNRMLTLLLSGGIAVLVLAGLIRGRRRLRKRRTAKRGKKNG